jgi:hypothetical protein
MTIFKVISLRLFKLCWIDKTSASYVPEGMTGPDGLPFQL